MKRKYYFAKRIPANAQADQLIDISPDMNARDIHRSYVDKYIEYENYISNGPWILRPIEKEDVFHPNNFPSDIVPYDVWDMVKCKIEMSDAIIALINPTSFGTIIEVGFASGLGTVAVYVLPDNKMTDEEVKDLWLVFQSSLQTRHLWQDEDIANAPIFLEYGITDIEEYGKFVSSIVPNFLSRR